MKKPGYWARILVAGLAVGCMTVGLSAREYYEDHELRGTIVKVDKTRKIFKLDRGPAHKLKLIYWSSKTKFLLNEKPMKPADLQVDQKVRVYYRNDLTKPEDERARAVKVVVSPSSDPRQPTYNK